MKRVLFSICGLMPGGFALLGAMVIFVGCARLQYQDPSGNARVYGYTTTPEMAVRATADAEFIRAEAYSIRRCADNSQHCGGQWGYYGGIETPAGYTLAGIEAAGAMASPALEKKLDDIADEVKTTKEGLKEFFRVRGKNSKRVKSRR